MAFNFKINKILFITLSNIGDVILTLPVLDSLKQKFPDAKITVMSGPRSSQIFQDNPGINRLIVYDKHVKLGEKIKLFNLLKKDCFDLVVDLRNSLFGALLPAKYKTSPFTRIPKSIKHAKDRHLYKLDRLLNPDSKLPTKSSFFYADSGEKGYTNGILRKNNISENDRIAVISCGARSHTKRWPKEKFAELIPVLSKEFGFKVILAGDKDDVSINKYITDNLKIAVLDSTGKTTLAQLSFLLKKAVLVVTNDSAVLHLASYLNRPVVAIFGPTDEKKYGPWSGNSAVVKKEIFCRPCQKAQCRWPYSPRLSRCGFGYGKLECLHLVGVEDVLRQIRNTLNRQIAACPGPSPQGSFKRILIARTDRIGDVLLSTPVIKALRQEYPNAYIAMMVSPYASQIIEGNPYLDRVIVYDKEGRHKRRIESVRFSLKLKKERFDLALILHPANRVHLITFFAGIKRRIGYDQKLGFLLTDRIRHAKQLGEKHEVDYNLDLVRYLGIKPQEKDLFMPIKPESEKYRAQLFQQEGIEEEDWLLAIHPGASCPSKIWPAQGFAEVADSLIERRGFKVLVVSGPKETSLASDVIKHMRHPAINLAGRTSVSQLASVLKRCRLFISNDSGPVHIASAVGVPVISIFGRNQKGLSPARWGPTGKKDTYLHKEVGCSECLAHKCIKGFACLKAITAEEVLTAAESILK